ncbi:MAG: hypothetical protein ACJ8ER_15665 [Allosphingosinicella sp.]
MIDHCGACGGLQTWRRGLLCCRCGAQHDRSAAEDADPSVASYILSRLSYGPVMSVPILDAMALVDAIRTMELLGATRLEWRAVKPRRKETEVLADRQDGLSVAIGWPASFRGTLDALVAKRPAAAAEGLMATYGWLYSEICVGDAPRAAADLVAPVLREHAVANGVIARDEERLGAKVPPTITATEVARRLGRSYATTRRLLDECDAVPDGSRRGVPFAIDPQIVAGVDRLRRKSPQSSLRVGRTQARGLMRDSQIAELVGVEKLSGEDLAGAVLARATAVAADNLLPLPVACRNMSVPLATACRGILADKIKVGRCGTVDDGLQAAMVRQSDLAELREPDEALGVQAVARLGGIHHEAALHLVREGVFGPQAHGRVARAEVSRFFKDHVTAAELARARRTSGAKVSRTLAAAGIRPKFGPPECRQLIYLRADVPTVH